MLKRMLPVLISAVLLVPVSHASTNASVIDEIQALEKVKNRPEPHEEKVRMLRLSNGQSVNTADWNVVLFMASDCSYCKRFDPVLKKVSEDTGVPVFPYSLNGESDATFPNAVPAPPAVVAAFFAQGLPVATPTTFLVNVNTMDTFPLLQGDATEVQISERLDTVFMEALKRIKPQPGGA
ncbi:type-F conjugative transfer system pilin assembly thiol-disulfide isomerase TrbB (plasmid) [Citrobacter cronae]|uniref:type-F conjugative transfer system pilin assembly thiol-disulfide isomerase TrbB n=1 Tax=Enterobacteriaceae TaxID=543 RepID=UPI0021820406|nr:type-F conjugative transfer system pilin assembly thiol-disulfide isomerase TrbB [Citrobacter freundii]UVD61979.1 type-F conjugative transfer system pilin assembly thiol-disulfide isomerase TrbB [Citrobacter freundii]